MIAVVRLYQSSISGRLPDVLPGQAFWAAGRDVAQLVASNLATVAPPNTPGPAFVEPPWTANQCAGVAKGTSNASH